MKERKQEEMLGKKRVFLERKREREVSVCTCYVCKVFEVFSRCNELGYKKGLKGGPKRDRFFFFWIEIGYI
jgi:hypothetical protein